MSGDDSSTDDSGLELSRRTFAKAAGAAAGAGLLGAASNTAAANHGGMAPRFANPRVQELQKVWARGYRGDPQRSIGLTDSGIDARHPDLGPWNGVEITEEDGAFTLKDQLVDTSRESVNEFGPETVGPGAGPGPVELTAFTPSAPRDRLDATMEWSPDERPQGNETNNLDLLLQRRGGDGGWETVAEAATGRPVEELDAAPVESGTEHRLAATGDLGSVSEIRVEGAVYERKPMDLGGVSDPFSHGPSNAKTIGWANPVPRYGNTSVPRDPDGHGSHCASIMGGSGRASEIAREVRQEEYDSRTVAFGNAIYTDVFVEEGEAGVYASAYGEGIEIEIEKVGSFDGPAATSTITSDASTNDNNTVSTPAAPGERYEVTIRGASNENSGAIAQGLNAVGTVESISVGTFADPGSTTGDREADDQVALHSGVAPDVSLVGLQGLSGPVPFLAEYADEFTSTFNLRAVNMSWGYVGGLPLGAAGGALGDVVGGIREMAMGGILTVAAAGNSATPANGNGAPAVADEAISVVATGPKDGISGYSSGGIGAVDDGDDGTYMKPDVTAPGGTLTDLVKAAKADSDFRDFDEDTEPQDYTGKAGTSMAAPFTNGVAALVADAMEDDTDQKQGKQLINDPAGSDANDVLRLKQVLLATASETAFTAAPYHRAKAPSYQGGGRDPYEGYGRVNPDAAVDAVTKNIYGDGDSLANDRFSPANRDRPVTSTYGVPDEDGNRLSVGLDVPDDSRAVAGFVDAPRGQLDLTVSTRNFRGDDVNMATGEPQVDVFVYDAENPGANGEPRIVTQGRIDATTSPGTTRRGTTTLTVDTGELYDLTWTGDEVGTRKLLVVAKLVNVPGLVNGFDARTDVAFNASFTPEFEPLPEITVEGTRRDSGDRFTAGSRNTVQVRLDSAEVTDGRILDRVPLEWGTPASDPDNDRTDYEGVVRTTETHRIIDLGAFDADDAANGTTRTYVVRAPDSNGSYTFGPARIQVTDDDDEQRGVQAPTGDGEGSFREREATFGGSDPRNVVVGGTSVQSDASTGTTDAGSATDAVGSTTSGDGGSATGTVGDTVEDTL